MSSSTFDDLDPESRDTASLLAEAFAGVRLDRPSPLTTQEQDAATAARLDAAFDAVHLAAPVPGPVTAPGADLVVLPAPVRRRRRWPAVLAAAAAVVVASGALLVGPTGSSPAWAATPRTPSAADVAAVTSACAAPIARGPGDLLSSGTVAVDGTPVDVPAGAAVDPPPTSLPPLVALDVRGDVAFAVYQDARWTVTCVARADGDGWRDQGVQVGPGSDNAQPGIVSGGGSATVDGEQVTTVTGAAPSGAVRVTFRLDDGTQVDASVRGAIWAAWFPGARSLDPASITAYDAAGATVR